MFVWNNQFVTIFLVGPAIFDGHAKREVCVFQPFWRALSDFLSCVHISIMIFVVAPEGIYCLEITTFSRVRVSGRMLQQNNR